MIASGGKLWFTATELADLALPGLPRTKRKINELAADGRWAFKLDARDQALARPRAGRGGGFEYHWSVLPPATKTALVQRGVVVELVELPVAANRDSLWDWFDGQSDKVKAEAERRLRVVSDVDAMVASGLSRSTAVIQAGAMAGVGKATVWNWLSSIEGVRLDDRKPHLAPRRAGGGAEADIDERAWTAFKSDYLRPEKPTLASCYERAKAIAEAHGWAPLPHLKTLQRKLEREVDKRVVIARREGADALRMALPPQKRSIAELRSLELVNIDGHRWDVFVRWPDGHIARPMMVAIQDVYSRKILAWRIGQTESAVLTRLAFADLFKNHGIPDGCLMDNGRAFASKWITGGSKTRNRFKIRDEEPTGLLTGLGVSIHWALPYRGSSKPIERAFRDLCDSVAKHPAFAGAYTGNRPDAKPENYGATAVDLDAFIKVASAGIAAHNARDSRRTEAARGRSFDAAFLESYLRGPIRRATEAQFRQALLAVDSVTVSRRDGSVSLYDNTYWSEALQRHAGKKVVLRFDPDDLAQEVHVYGLDGAYLCAAPLWGRVGFQDVDAAKARARQEADLRKATKRKIELEQLINAEELAKLLPEVADDEPTPTPTVIRPVRHRGATAAAVKAAPTPHVAAQDTVADRLASLGARLTVVK